VSAPDHMSPAALAASAYEVVLVLCGLWLTWKCVLAPAGPAGRPQRLAPWDIPPIDFACFLCFAFVGATAVSAAASYLLKHAHLSEDQSMVAGGAVMHIGILVGVAGFFAAYGARQRPLAGDSGLRADLLSGLATFLIGVPIVAATSIAWDYVVTKLGLPDDKQDMVQILEDSHSKGLILALVAVATLLVPVTEELVFRAGLFRYFRTRVPRWAAVLLTSVLFGALHMSWSSFAPLTVLAVLFCLAYERTGSIRTTMVAHALFNLNTFIIVVAGLGQ
jgi:membrane protease YdiL (CAAX protease family)